jgi:A/G-specific adenine glycosylase
MAKAQGRAEAYPVRSRKLKRSQRALAWLVLRQGDRVWLVHRPDSGIWAGLWSLPEFENPQAVLDALSLAQDAPRPTVWSAFTHVLTHLDLRITPVEVCWPQAQALPSDWPGAWDQGWPGRWVSPAQALELGLPTPARRLLLAPPDALSR